MKSVWNKRALAIALTGNFFIIGYVSGQSLKSQLVKVQATVENLAQALTPSASARQDSSAVEQPLEKLAQGTQQTLDKLFEQTANSLSVPSVTGSTYNDLLGRFNSFANYQIETFKARATAAISDAWEVLSSTDLVSMMDPEDEQQLYKNFIEPLYSYRDKLSAFLVDNRRDIINESGLATNAREELAQGLQFKPWQPAQEKKESTSFISQAKAIGLDALKRFGTAAWKEAKQSASKATTEGINVATEWFNTRKEQVKKEVLEDLNKKISSPFGIKPDSE